MKFIAYDTSFLDDCLRLFDENCPQYFAKNEKEDYLHFLKALPSSYYVVMVDKLIVSAFGLSIDTLAQRGRLSWILVSPNAKGTGLGVQMMAFAKNKAIENHLLVIDIAASHLSAPFFAKFGAQTQKQTLDGWGRGMHRVDMELLI